MSETSAAAAPPAPAEPAPVKRRGGLSRGFVSGILPAAAAAASAWLPAFAERTEALSRSVPAPAGTLQTVPPAWCAAAALLAGTGAAWIGCRVRPPRRAWSLVLAAAALAVAQSFVFKLHGVLWEPFSLLTAAGAGFLFALIFAPKPGAPGEVGVPGEGPGAETARRFYGRVSAPLLRRLAAVEDANLLQPAQREGTVVTCRLLNEHALREHLPARDFLKLSEAFRARAGRVLMEHGGCLDTAESAGVRAFFGLPLDSPAAADEAATAALALDEALRRFSVDHMRASAEPPVFGIGLASGTLTAGVTDEHYSVLGDAVELSRWLAAENTNYHSRILMDERTRARAANMEDRPLEVCNPPEGAAAVEIFQLLSPRGGLNTEAVKRRDAFRDAIMLLRAGHAADAIQRFQEARRGLLSPDLVLEHFLNQAEDQLRRDQSSPALARRKNRPFRKTPRHP